MIRSDTKKVREMNSSGIVMGILFIVGIVAIFISQGAMMYMLVGDALIAIAGLSSFVLSK